MPNLEAIRLWVEDLRTTDAPQGQGSLVRGGAYCCLGRACEVYRTHVGGEWTTGACFKDVRGFSDGCELPEGVADWFGFEGAKCDPYLLDTDGRRRSAAEMNDGEGYTFAQIADAVERTFLSNA